MTARFAYTVTCDCCGWQERGEVMADSFLGFDEQRDVQVECPVCGPGDFIIARRIPTSPKAERRQLAKGKRTPLRFTPRSCVRTHPRARG